MTDQIAELQSRSDTELFAMLGRLVDSGVAGENDAVAAETGRTYFNARLGKFGAAVCNNALIAKLREEHADSATLIAAIIDALSALGGVPGVATVAILLIRYGLDKLCGAPVPNPSQP